jgi:hypothetical protein
MIVPWLMTAVVGATAGMGCGSHRDDPEIEVVRSALTAAEVFGFEDPSGWSTTTAGVGLTKSTTHSQGSFSLQVTPSRTNGFTPIVSTRFSTLTGVSPTLAWDVMLPTQQPNPNWFGTAQMYMNCPSRNIYSAFLGQVELTGKPLNTWYTVTFPLSNTQITGLLQAGYTDLTLTVVINVPVPTTGIYRIDNLRFVPAAANACGGRPNGTSCTDGNSCTTADTCQAGACKPGTAVVCKASDQCHSAGVCDRATGLCSNPAQVDGTTCDDGDKCTQTDTCQAGVCSGANPVPCVASDACHVAGTCVPATGACTNPPAPDGTSCNDQNACTATDTCQTSVCVGSNAPVCPPLDQCHVGVCDPVSGVCGFQPAANGTACDDGNACTSGDTCQSGVCGGIRDSLCGVSVRFEGIYNNGSGGSVAIFSYTNPSGSAVSAPYGTRNFISVDGQMVETPSQPVPTSLNPGDNPGALSYPLPAGATTVSWTLGSSVATSSGPVLPLGTNSNGDPTVTVTNATGDPLTVAFDVGSGGGGGEGVTPTIRLTVSPTALTVQQGGSVTATISIERVGGYSDPIVLGPAGQVGLKAILLPIGVEPVSSYTLVLKADPDVPLGTQMVTILDTNYTPSAPDQPMVTFPVTTVAPAVSNVSIASLNMKAPLTLQGVQSWSAPHFSNINNFLTGDAVGIDPMNYTSTPIPAFIADPDAPRWVKGNGFSVNDKLGLGAGSSGMPRVIVGTSKVSFNVDLSLTDDTSALEMTATANTYDPMNIGTGVSSCTSSLMPSVVEGNHGKYTVRIERWDPSATNCKASERLDPDYPLDEVTFNGPSPDAHTGCWVPVKENKSDLYSSQPYPDLSGAGINGPIAPKNGTASKVMSVPVDLPGIANYLRYVVKLELADTRVPTDNEVIGWDSMTRMYPNAAACMFKWSLDREPFGWITAPTTGQGYACPMGDGDPNEYIWTTDVVVPFCPPAVPVVALPGMYSNEGPLTVWRFRRPADTTTGGPQHQSFVYQKASNPFQVVVEPIAIAQLKVLPLTILYQPPGNQSTATYTLSQSFGTNMSASNLLENGQSTEVDSKASTGTSTSAKGGIGSLGGSGEGISEALKASGFSISEKFEDSSTWDHTTNLGTGRSSQIAVANSATFEAVNTTSIGPNKSLMPGAAGTYDQEPFWNDVFLTIVHPQLGVWQMNQDSAIILLGADGAPSSPALFAVTVRQLDQCARRVDPFANGIKINTSTHVPADSTDVLDANDCLQLVQLDPFYGVGQSLPTAPSARVVRPQNAVTSVNYGTSLDGQPLTQKISNVITYSNSSTTTDVATYKGTVTDVFTRDQSGEVSLSLYGFDFGWKFSGSGSTSKVTSWTVTFQSSFEATVKSSIGVEGSLADDHPTAQYPAVFVFQDTAFGTFMFQDKDAPAAP